MAFSLVTAQNMSQLPHQVVHYRDDAENDNDKALAVPSGELWEVVWVFVELAATATVGTRRLELQVRDGSANVVFVTRSTATQEPSSTETYRFYPRAHDLDEGNSGEFYNPTPQLFVPGGYDIRVHDVSNRDANDDLTVDVFALKR